MSRIRPAFAVLLVFASGALSQPAAAGDLQFDAPVTVWQGAQYSFPTEPSLAVDTAGRPQVTWRESQAGAAFAVRFSRSADDRGSFGAPTLIWSSGYGSDIAPRLATGGDAVAVVWTTATKGYPGDIRLRRSTDGAAFGTEVLLSPFYARDGDVAGDASGSLFVVGSGRLFVPVPGAPPDAGIWIRRSSDGGATFDAARLIIPDAVSSFDRQTSQRIAVGPAGRLHLVWVWPDAADQPRLWASRSLDGGTSFSPPLAISDGGAAAHTPALVVGPSGTVHVVWHEGRVAPQGAAVVMYSGSSDGGATFSTPRPVSGGEPGSLSVQGAQVTEPIPGAVVVAYASNRTGTGADLVLRTSRDGGISFGAPQLVDEAPVAHDSPALTSRAGIVFVAWPTGVTDPGGRLVLWRGTVRLDGGGGAPPVFTDVPADHWARAWIEELYRVRVTWGCSAAPLAYCPDTAVSREQMAVFLLRAVDGPDYAPPPCAGPVFTDVSCSSPFASWVHELVRRDVTAGCGNGAYCPAAPVTREAMAVFLLRARDPGFVPAGCTGLFVDVSCASGFAPWIEELVHRGVAAGCASVTYCPSSPVTRAQMAVFLVKTFGL